MMNHTRANSKTFYTCQLLRSVHLVRIPIYFRRALHVYMPGVSYVFRSDQAPAIFRKIGFCCIAFGRPLARVSQHLLRRVADTL